MLFINHSKTIVYSFVGKKNLSFYHLPIHLIFSIFMLSILLMPGCSNDNKIEEDKMVLIYTDLIIAQDTTALDENNLDSLRSSVFDRYKVTENEYEATIEYYNEEQERWEIFFDKVTAYIETLKQGSG